MEELLVKLLADAPLAAIIGLALYWYRPILTKYLEQQARQLELITEAMQTFAERLGRVERKVNEIAEEIDVHA